MKTKLFTTAILLLFCTTGFAQRIIITHQWQVRKAFESEDDKKEPVTLSLTLPHGEASSVLFSGGVSSSWQRIRADTSGRMNGLLEISPFVVANFNNLIADKQKNFKVGANLKHLLGHVTYVKGNASEITGVNQQSYFTLNHALEYMRDYEERSHSLLYTIYLSQFRNVNRRGSLFLNTYKPIGKAGFHYLLGYNAGFEWQDKLEAENVGLQGSIIRNFHNADFRLLLQRDPGGIHQIGNPVGELKISYTGRYDLLNQTDKKDKYLPLLITALAYFPTGSRNFAISGSYNRGSDPLKGLNNQHFWLIALTFKR